MIRNLRLALSSLAESRAVQVNRVNKSFLVSKNFAASFNFNRTKKDDSALFRPVPIKAWQDDINVGAEITGSAIDKAELLKILNKFSQKREIRLLCIEHGMDRKMMKIFDAK